MACSSGELHAICFLWAHVFYVLIPPFFTAFFPNNFSPSIGVKSMNMVIMSICPKLTKFFG